MSLDSLDVVYTWVDGDRTDYLELLRTYSKESRDLNPERFRDPWAMLRYSLRSLFEHAPWVGRVLLFTCRPHCPAWLHRDHPRVKLVHHDEVIDPQYLPTFNSNVIESFLHRLPVQGDFFLYLNDDYFLGRPCSLMDFLTDSGQLRVFGTLMGERLKRLYERPYFPSLGFLEHAPLLVHRPSWEAALAYDPAELERTRRTRFRSPRDLRPDRLYRYHLLGRPGVGRVPVGVRQFLQDCRFHKIVSRPGAQRRALARLRQARPKFFCLNDDQGPRLHPEVVTTVRSFLQDYFPRPCPLEREDGP